PPRSAPFPSRAGGAPPMSLRSPYPKWSINRSPMVNTIAPANNPTVVHLSRPSVVMPLATSSNATALSHTPATNDITVPSTFGFGVRRSATPAPISSDAAAASPQNSASAMAKTSMIRGDWSTLVYRRAFACLGLTLTGDDGRGTLTYFRSRPDRRTRRRTDHLREAR